jgi:hypothetical protein
MHCVAGDGIGILAGAVIGAVVALPMIAEVVLEYVLGFTFGWTIFQALFMRDRYGGDYVKSLAGTFLPEFLSMNCLMGGMLPMAAIAFAHTPGAHEPTEPLFWFRLSLALMTGALVAFPINWWMVAHHLKHGMMTVRPVAASAQGGMKMDMGEGGAGHTPSPPVSVMTVLSLVVLAIGAAIAFTFGSGH